MLRAAGLLLLLTTAVLAAPAPPYPEFRPTGLAISGSDLLITDIGTHRLLRRNPAGVLAVLAGTGEGGFSGDGGPASKARLHAPHDTALDRTRSVLVADTYNHRVRRIDRLGMIRTIAGNGRAAYAGDGGPAVKASLNNPQGIAVAQDGALYIADTYNHMVRRVDGRGIITTFAGSEPGLAGDGGPAVKAQLSLPNAVAVAPDGSVYISDSGNNRIRRVRPDGIIETVLGTGPGSGTAGAGYGGDGGPAEKGRIFAAADVEVTPSGDLLVSDSGNHRLRLVSNGIVNSVTGRELPFRSPQKLAVGARGELYVATRATGAVWVLGEDGTPRLLPLRFALPRPEGKPVRVRKKSHRPASSGALHRSGSPAGQACIPGAHTHAPRGVPAQHLRNSFAKRP